MFKPSQLWSHARAPHIALGVILAIYFCKEWAMIQKFPASFIGDGDSASSTWAAARVFVEQGFGGSAGLPVWKGVTYETPVAKLLESGVYSHYFPGPEYMLYLVMSVFGWGTGMMKWAKLWPMLHTLLPILVLAHVARDRILGGWRWSVPWVSAIFLSAPAFYIWSLDLHGNAYASTYVQLAFVLGLLWGDRSCRREAWIKVGLFACGFLMMYMLLTDCFIAMAAPTVAMLLHSDRPGWRKMLASVLLVGTGTVVAFALHFLQVAWFLNSFELAWIDQFKTLIDRSYAHDELPSGLLLIGQYSDHVRAWFRWNSSHMAWLGVIGSLVSLASHQVRARGAIAVLVSFVASSLWLVTMKRHAFIHTHLDPRVYQLLFMAWALVMVRLIAFNDLKGRPPA